MPRIKRTQTKKKQAKKIKNQKIFILINKFIKRRRTKKQSGGIRNLNGPELTKYIEYLKGEIPVIVINRTKNTKDDDIKNLLKALDIELTSGKTVEIGNIQFDRYVAQVKQDKVSDILKAINNTSNNKEIVGYENNNKLNNLGNDIEKLNEDKESKTNIETIVTNITNITKITPPAELLKKLKNIDKTTIIQWINDNQASIDAANKSGDTTVQATIDKIQNAPKPQKIKTPDELIADLKNQNIDKTTIPKWINDNQASIDAANKSVDTTVQAAIDAIRNAVGGKRKSKKTNKVRKHRGIVQTGGSAGRLRKGYKYTGRRLKNGQAEIKKVKQTRK